jgi:hypothetical protein
MVMPGEGRRLPSPTKIMNRFVKLTSILTIISLVFLLSNLWIYADQMNPIQSQDLEKSAVEAEDSSQEIYEEKIDAERQEDEADAASEEMGDEEPIPEDDESDQLADNCEDELLDQTAQTLDEQEELSDEDLLSEDREEATSSACVINSESEETDLEVDEALEQQPLIEQDIALSSSVADETVDQETELPEGEADEEILQESDDSRQDKELNQTVNDATQDMDLDVEANTGYNQSLGEDQEDADISTGDATALANLLNQLNLDIYQSLFRTLFIDVGEDFEGDIDLNELWSQLVDLQASLSGDYPDSLANNVSGSSSNNADLNNNINLAANTGGNQLQTNGDGTLSTGNATSLVNLINLVNLSVIDSVFLLSTINIGADYSGNIILPRPEKLAEWQAEYLENQLMLEDGMLFEGMDPQQKLQSVLNLTQINEQINVDANTGDNELVAEGSSELETGDAMAIVNSTNIVNSTFFFDSWYYLVLNDWGNWTGQTNLFINQFLLPWLVGAHYNQPVSSDSLQMEADSSTQLTNQASINTQIHLSADTGQNEVIGENTKLTTGDAQIGANLTNIVNSSFYHSKGFMSWINIMNGWSGNLIFAYPDLGINLDGQLLSVDAEQNTASYRFLISYANIGYDLASDHLVSLTVPSNGSLVSSSPENTEQTTGLISWLGGPIQSAEVGAKEVVMELDLPEEDSPDDILITAIIETTDPEQNYTNNQSAININLANLIASDSSHYEEVEIDAMEFLDEDLADSGEVMLMVESGHNAESHIFPGDTIVFDIQLQNQGTSASHETYVVHNLFDKDYNLLASYQFPIGKVMAGRRVSIDFEFRLNPNANLPAGVYYTATQAFGVSANNDWRESNLAWDDFLLRLLSVSSRFVPVVVGDEGPVSQPLERSPQVLGAATKQERSQDPELGLVAAGFLLLLASAAVRARKLMMTAS